MGAFFAFVGLPSLCGEGGGGDFEGADVVGDEVVDGDAEEIVAGGWDGDLLVSVGSAGEHGVVDGGQEDGRDRFGDGVDDFVAVGVVDADSVLE